MKPRKAKTTKAKKKPAKVDPVDAKRAKSYCDMENSVCEIAQMGTLAMNCFDDPDQGLFIFAVGHLEWMLQRFRERYYAEEFPIDN
jgi:hypothetical protein